VIRVRQALGSLVGATVLLLGPGLGVVSVHPAAAEAAPPNITVLIQCEAQYVRLTLGPLTLPAGPAPFFLLPLAMQVLEAHGIHCAPGTLDIGGTTD
jgi:O-antigen ligase